MSEPATFAEWVVACRLDALAGSERMLLQAAWDAALASMRADLVARAELQESFAGPNYPHHSEADRRMFRHAAAQLRSAAS